MCIYGPLEVRKCKKTRFPSSTLLPFFLEVPLLKPNSRKKGTLIIKGLLGNLEELRAPLNFPITLTQVLSPTPRSGELVLQGFLLQGRVPPHHQCSALWHTDHMPRLTV